jgi:hypothetical protein
MGDKGVGVCHSRPDLVIVGTKNHAGDPLPMIAISLAGCEGREEGGVMEEGGEAGGVEPGLANVRSCLDAKPGLWIPHPHAAVVGCAGQELARVTKPAAGQPQQHVSSLLRLHVKAGSCLAQRHDSSWPL